MRGGVICAGKIVLLYGNMGAGKTVLVRGICAALGVDERDVSSPTFNIVNEYLPSHDNHRFMSPDVCDVSAFTSALGHHASGLSIYHFDAYRLTPEDWYGGGFDEYVRGDSICLVEWAEKLPQGIYNSQAVCITITGSGDESREVQWSG
ncbi:tRNA (adenosine(37)-N6)-threonylcarbamoyltransferase complex ATPase subunit type 1 TsaE [Clostridia bacterium]|nr:tRNA (adenosine(37)-N6)-threonylcarbamoyltransferase complex ATPase subunit type 1 TsaE [Clostridia bacterium]